MKTQKKAFFSAAAAAAAAAFAFAIFVFSCSAISSSSEKKSEIFSESDSDSDSEICGSEENFPEGKGRVSVVAIIEGGVQSERTISSASEGSGAEGLSYELSGILKNEDGSQKESLAIKSWQSLSDAKNDGQIFLDAGRWLFTLKGQKDGSDIFSGSVSATVLPGLKTTLTFFMAACRKKGAADVSLCFPCYEKIASVKAGLFTFSWSEVAGFELSEVPFSKEADGEKFLASYKKSGIPSGAYIIQFNFYMEDGSEIKPAFAEAIQIKSEETSFARREIFEFEKTHTISYEWGSGADAQFCEGYSPPLFFNEQQNVSLPDKTQIKREGFFLVGWYQNQSLRSSEKKSGWNAGEQKSSVTLYAKWARDLDALGECKESGGRIFFGTYPKTKKQGETEIFFESDSDGENKTVRGGRTYFLGSDGEWYAKASAFPYDSQRKFLDGSAISKNAQYYFKVEALEWDFHSENSSEKILVSKNIISARPFSNAFSSSANQYSESQTRAFLKGEFLAEAFADGQKEKLNGHGVFGDKVFLLSQAQAESGVFKAADVQDSFRVKIATDFARSEGCYFSESGAGYWWLCTQDDYAFFYVRGVDPQGLANGAEYATLDDTGVVPAVSLKK